MRRLTWLLPVLLGAFLLPACSSDPDPQQVVAGAADATVKAGSARVHEVLETVGGPAAGRAIGDGAFDFEARKGQLHMTTQGQDVEIVMHGTDIYEKVPGLEDQVGTPWLHLDFDALGDAVGVEQLSSLMDSSSNDPSSMLADLRGAGKVAERGTAKVRGASTTRYHAVVDFEEAAKAAATKAQAKALRQGAKLLGLETQDIDVWIDGDGRTRRMSQTIDYSHLDLPEGLPEGTADALPDSMTITVEYYDFGVEVDAEVPDADDVTEFSDLVDQGKDAAPVQPIPEHVVLERSLLTEVPAGYERGADEDYDTGPSDLAKATRDQGGDDSGLNGFVAGYQRIWVNADEDQIIVFLYQFDTPSRASSFITTMRASARDSGDGQTIEPVTVTGVPGATAVHSSDPDADAFIGDVAHGVYALRIELYDGGSAELLSSLLAQQVARLGPA